MKWIAFLFLIYSFQVQATNDEIFACLDAIKDLGLEQAYMDEKDASVKHSQIDDQRQRTVPCHRLSRDYSDQCIRLSAPDTNGIRLYCRGFGKEFMKCTLPEVTYYPIPCSKDLYELLKERNRAYQAKVTDLKPYLTQDEIIGGMGKVCSEKEFDVSNPERRRTCGYNFPRYCAADAPKGLPKRIIRELLSTGSRSLCLNINVPGELKAVTLWYQLFVDGMGVASGGVSNLISEKLESYNGVQCQFLSNEKHCICEKKGCKRCSCEKKRFTNKNDIEGLEEVLVSAITELGLMLTERGLNQFSKRKHAGMSEEDYQLQLQKNGIGRACGKMLKRDLKAKIYRQFHGGSKNKTCGKVRLVQELCSKDDLFANIRHGNSSSYTGFKRVPPDKRGEAVREYLDGVADSFGCDPPRSTGVSGKVISLRQN